jgi:hypothetical protein
MLSAFRTVRRFIAPEIHDHEGRGSACRPKAHGAEELCLVVTARSGNTHDPKIIEWGWIKR